MRAPVGVRVRNRIALSIGMVALSMVAACGDDSTAGIVRSPDQPIETSSTSAPTSWSTTVIVDGARDQAEVDAVAEVLRRRLDALEVAGFELSTTEAFIEVTAAEADEDLVRAALQKHRIEVRPVLSVRELTEGDQVNTPNDRPADPTAPVNVTDLAGTRYYELGPVVLDGSSFESATALDDPAGRWSVTTVLRDGASGIDAFNAMARECFEGTPQCPRQDQDRGMLAFTDDLVVLSAPSVNAAEFERDQIQMAGGYDEQQAKVLAAVLGAGAPPVSWTATD